MSTIYLVVPRGTIVLGAYSRHEPALVHERSATGLETIELEVLDTVPAEVAMDVGEYDDDDITPVITMRLRRPKSPQDDK